MGVGDDSGKNDLTKGVKKCWLMMSMPWECM